MDDRKKQMRTYTLKMRIIPSLILVIAGILINILGAKLALHFEWKLFLDSVGTILVAALAGYLPGIITGFATNLINGISDPTTAYYSVISVLIAVYASYAAKRNYFSKPLKSVITIPVFAVIGGGIGSVLTWLLYGFSFGSGISAFLSVKIYEELGLNKFLSQLSADLILDIADKAITVILVVVVYKLLSPFIEAHTDFNAWKQAPLDDKSALKTSRWFSSLRFKISVCIFLVLLTIAGVTMTVNFHQFSVITKTAQSEIGLAAAELVKEEIDPEKTEEYISSGAEDKEYIYLSNEIDEIRETFPDIESIHVFVPEKDGYRVVFDSTYEKSNRSLPGEMKAYDKSLSGYTESFITGKGIEPQIVKRESGKVLSVYSPVYDSKGQCACWIVSDISMDTLTADEFSFLAKGSSIFLSFMIFVMALGLRLSKYHIVVPLNSMAQTAGDFAFNSEKEKEEHIKKLNSLEINTGDEIENLYKAISKTSEDMVSYIADIEEKSQKMAHMQDSLIVVLADMVESRDKFTGDHIKRTAAYLCEILMQLRADGLYTDILTDEYIEDVVHSAPLHDIGKIKISDTILNKPGKLTDEEYDIMKTHTLAGKEIITGAADAVSESGYLYEAETLAAYHHERWDGKGYPYGLKGDEIPLSARCMAVADVFDALVSKRSYKEGFPVEKALEIIKECSGTQFDPQIVDAFMKAEDKIRLIAEDNG